MARRSRLLCKLIAALVALVGASPSLAATAGRPLAVCIARVGAHDGGAAAMFAHPDRFDCTTPQAAFGPGSFWVLAKALPAGTGGTLDHVRVSSQWQDRLTLHARYADGTIAVLSLDSHGMATHMRLDAVVEQVLPHRHVALTGLLWRVDGSGNFRRILGDAQVMTDGQSDGAMLRAAAIYAAFGGIGIALLIYNLTLWVALRRQFQLAYCAMVAGLILYAIASSGALSLAFPWLANDRRIEISYLMLPVSTATALWFARTVFEPFVIARWLTRAITATIALLVGTAATFALFAPWQMLALDRLVGLAYVMVVAITGPLLWQAWRRGPGFLAVFALAWAAPAMLAVMRVTNTFHLLPISFSLATSMMAIITVEALLSSLAIAYRIHLLSRERDEAREQEIAARLLAATDPLTGLLNRRAFLEQAIGRRGDQMLLLADIDHFKRVNETIGHDGGDEVLRVLSRALRGSVPASALVARIGGEEFAILAPADSGLSATAILDRLRAERMPFDLSVTASIGTCTGPLTREVDWKSLYRCADRALFEAKAAGRDRARDAGSFAFAA